MKRNAVQPPAWAMRFFDRFCNEHLSDAVMGDLVELYERRRKFMGKRKADLLFVFNVIQFLQPFAMRKRQRHHANQLDMLRNYLVIAWRVIARQRMYSAIKMGGFAIGIATCMIIALYIRHEMRYDGWYADKDRVFRLYNEDKEDNSKWSSFPAPIAANLRDELPEIELVGRLIPYKWYNAGSNLFRRDDQVENIYEEGFAYADPELLEILSIPMVAGNRASALAAPRSIVISRRIAEKYFPGDDPVGHLVVLNDQDSIPFTVGGVMANIREISHLDFDFLITLSGREFWPGEQTSWCCWNYNPYIKLRPGTDPAEFEKKLLSIRDKYYLGYMNERKEPGADKVRKYHAFRLQPVEDIYLRSEGIHSNVRYGDIRYVRLLGAVAVFILLLACVNFVNLATARSANRAKEVGLRKVVGSVRGLLVRQFLTESILVSILSFLMALGVVMITLPYFNRVIGASLFIPWSAWWFLPLLLAASMVVGVCAGLYPSVYLSSFKPADVLKGSLSRGAKSSVLRGTLVVFQFTVSIVLLIGTFIIHRQIKFILNTKVGFDKEQVIMIEGANTMEGQQSFKEELETLAGVQHVTISSYLPVHGTIRDQNGFWKEGKSKEENSIGAQRWYVDDDYLDALGIRLLEGRNFDPTVASDSQAIIINQAMAAALNLENPVGARIQNWETYTVIGLVEDFHFESMKGRIGPLSLVYGTWGQIVCVKVNTADMRQAISNITRVWDRFMPNQPARYSFLDESYARMYADVERTGRIFTVFAVLAIGVACLGLFALSAFMVEQRGKEISIRLVLGASVGNIFRLLTQNFVMLVIIALAIGTPIGWYGMRWWLRDYEYRITIGWDVFVIAGSAAVLIALLTVCYQSLKMATANPVERLRND